MISKAPLTHLYLKRDTTAVQIVDGNNFIMNRLHAGHSVRMVIDEINACQTPPLIIGDGFDGNARRRAIFPPYKVRTAEELVSRENLQPAMDMFAKLIPLTKAVVIRVPYYEADDVIATVAKAQAGDVIIVSTDRDLSQLAVLPNITCLALMTGVEPQWVRLYKTFVGDGSDKIPGVKGCGLKTWANLHWKLAQRVLETGTNFAEITAQDLNIGPAVHQWCCLNNGLVHSLWEIVGLLDVPMDLIVKNMKVGTSQPDVINAVLKEFML